jgi:hypothetical protein
VLLVNVRGGENVRKILQRPWLRWCRGFGLVFVCCVDSLNFYGRRVECVVGEKGFLCFEECNDPGKVAAATYINKGARTSPAHGPMPR